MVQAHPTAEAALSEQALAGLRERLLSQVEALRAKAAALRGELATKAGAASNTFVAGIEGAMVAEESDDLIALLQHEQHEWQAVHAALARMNQGEYGLCEACGGPIGLARLEIVPEATLCVECQVLEERRVHR